MPSVRVTNGVELTLPPSFPAGEYTPHGYIDNPHHSMVLNRSGMLRSVPPLGLGYWCRTFKGCYGTGPRRHVNYLSLLQLSVNAGGLRLVTPEDFAAAGIELVSRYHTCHVLSYDWETEELTFRLKYFLPREHTLACLVEISNAGDEPREVVLHASHIYGLWEQRWWGADGVGMRYLPDDDVAVSSIWAYGDYFALGANAATIAHWATADRAQWIEELRAGNIRSVRTAHVRGPGPLYSVLSYRLVAPPAGTTNVLVALSRAPNEPAALAELATGLNTALVELNRQLDADEDFWSHCPQLEGDWPDAWKHGWVYDWETLRMNVRRPLGIFKHPWDAMQAHSPRSVLGEASVDMLALGYADAELAQDVLYGTFADAPQPNVPCCREDGSMNMVAADGQACGTAPSWCFPFHVIRAVYAAHRDDAWIRRLYPHLKRYLDWWLENRVDARGWFRVHCDWESGQDGSKRFPEAEGGDAESVATIDVEASMVEALRNMAQFAQIADQPEDRPRWQALAERKAESARGMFVDGWFRDFDTRTGEPFLTPGYWDVMMLAPLTCGVAAPEQIEQVRGKFQHFRDHPTPWLEWPSFFLAFTEAAWTAGLRRLVGEATADIADRIYPRNDQRGLRFADAADPFAYRVPGVACEYWPVREDTEPGGENYGWGATLPAHVIRQLIGFREVDELHLDIYPTPPDIEFHVAPALPARLMAAGRSYGIRNLRFRGVEIALRYDVADERKLHVTLETVAARAGWIEVLDADGQTVEKAEREGASDALEFDAVNGEVLRVRITG